MSGRSLARLRVIVAIGVPSGFLAVAGLLAARRWPDYWEWIAREQVPMTFVQALPLFNAGLAAALLGLLAAMRRSDSARGASRGRRSGGART